MPLPDESARLDALRQYRILDTVPEQAFDDITALAAAICRTPMALISLMDESRQWFKSRIGLDETETSREIAFCDHAVTARELFVVRDALEDERFATNPLVLSEPGIRFYAGAPLVSAEGFVLGTLSVGDRVPRELTGEQAFALRALARQVVVQLELRKSLFVQERTAEERRRIEGRFRALIEHSSDAIALFKPDGAIVYASPSTSRVLGFEADEFVRFNALQIIHPDDRDRAAERVREALRRPGEIVEGVARVIHKDGSWRVCEGVFTNLLHDPDVGAIVNNYRDITERVRAEQEVRASREQLQVALQAAGMGVWDFNPTAGEFLWTDTTERLFGIEPGTPGVTLAAFLARVHPDDREPVESALGQAASGREGQDIEFRVMWPDGSIRWVECKGHVLKYEAGQPARFAGVVMDITERKELEQHLLQARKMEAVGRLAGGVAHDFNNLLTALIGYSEFALQRLTPDDPMRADIEEIHKAGLRAAALTSQLLAFSRRQMLQPKVINLNDVVSGLGNMLRRLIGEDVTLEAALDDSLAHVKADPGQIEQVILNLAVNARDAMPGGGRLLLETRNAHLDEEAARQANVRPGPYVVLRVTDTGSGMSEETRAQIFEPFFTTKERGKGTGLGLSTVYGVVAQSGGHIRVLSEPTRGTTFEIYLPQVDAAPPALAPESWQVPRGAGTLLVVEDEPQVRALAAAVLRAQGYVVLEAADGEQALRVAADHPGQIDLLVTDLVMPRMTGSQLAERLTAERPRTAVLYMSGYAENAALGAGELQEGAAFLQKPFLPDALVAKVGELLSSRARGGDPTAG